MQYRVEGEVPKKHHIAFRGPDQALRWEECITRDGFEGAYTIAYHLHRPHEHEVVADAPEGYVGPVAAPEGPLRKRHFLSQGMKATQGPAGSNSAFAHRAPILFNDDVTVSVLFPDAADPVYSSNGDGDDLVWIFQGSGVLRSLMGDVRFAEGDYVYVPKGVMHRFVPDEGVEQYWLAMHLPGGLWLPRQWRNEVGQLRMDAPFCHRDFHGPDFQGPVDEGIREVAVRRGGRWTTFRMPHNPLDLVGWDGAVYPWRFHILDFQPRAGLVHLPPTWHGTFATRGALVCSFVPRAVDFHPEAIPCPYPHHSVDMDEFLFYAKGNFTSRKGVGPGSVSYHPAGIPHGPHPGAYEASIGHRDTNELAVMLDTMKPMRITTLAAAVEDAGYHDSFRE
jgi:homogentisate 1,2-dioxygenase